MYDALVILKFIKVLRVKNKYINRINIKEGRNQSVDMLSSLYRLCSRQWTWRYMSLSCSKLGTMQFSSSGESISSVKFWMYWQNFSKDWDILWLTRLDIFAIWHLKRLRWEVPSCTRSRCKMFLGQESSRNISVCMTQLTEVKLNSPMIKPTLDSYKEKVPLYFWSHNMLIVKSSNCHGAF